MALQNRIAIQLIIRESVAWEEGQSCETERQSKEDELVETKATWVENGRMLRTQQR